MAQTTNNQLLQEEEISYSQYLKECKQVDALYSEFQKNTNLADSEFWCLYLVYQGECRYQHEISSMMYMSKQTIHSALKQLLKKEMIRLETPKDNQRLREIVLTEKGLSFAKQYFAPLDKAEQKAWQMLKKEEKEIVVKALQLLYHTIDKELKQQSALQDAQNQGASNE